MGYDESRKIYGTKGLPLAKENFTIVKRNSEWYDDTYIMENSDIYDTYVPVTFAASETPIISEYDEYLGNSKYADAFFNEVGIKEKFGSLKGYITDFCTDNDDDCGACPGYRWSTNKSNAKIIYERKDLGLTLYRFDAPHPGASGGLVLKTPKAIELMSQIMIQKDTQKDIDGIEWKNVTQINLVWDV